MSRLNQYLNTLVGQRVQLGRGGPDSNKGYLIGVKEDYLSLLTEDGPIVHYWLQHLRSVTAIAAEEGQAPDAYAMANATGKWQAQPEKFWDLLRAHHGQKIQLYEHGPETASGWVFEVGDDYVSLVVSPDELVRYYGFHIRSMSLPRPKKKNGDKKDGEKKDGDKKDGEKKDDGDKKADDGGKG